MGNGSRSWSGSSPCSSCSRPGRWSSIRRSGSRHIEARWTASEEPEEILMQGRVHGGRGRIVNDRKVVEAILLLREEPVPASPSARSSSGPPPRSSGFSPASPAPTPKRSGGSSCVRPPVAGASTPAPIAPLGWSASSVAPPIPALPGRPLEVLAIVAYKGPLSRSAIADIRGVDSDGVVRTLVGRGLLVEAGRKEEAPVSPVLFGVSGLPQPPRCQLGRGAPTSVLLHARCRVGRGDGVQAGAGRLTVDGERLAEGPGSAASVPVVPSRR